MSRLACLTACLMLLLAAGAAQAQFAPQAGPGGSNQRVPNRGLAMPGALPDPGGAGTMAGARLEPGAVLCRTAEALGRRQASVTAQAQDDQDEATALPAGCVLVGTRLPVEVLERRGPGRTRVRTTGPRREEGWTDAWLPERR